jgi:hypothetical protein
MDSLAAMTAYQTGQYLAWLVLGSLLIALLARLMRGDRAPRARVTDGIAALVVAALLIGGIARASGDDGGSSWKSDKGTELRAGFLAGCTDTSGAPSYCQCLFDRLVGQASYDTPDEFAALERPVTAAVESGDPADVPPGVVSAIETCVGAES